MTFFKNSNKKTKKIINNFAFSIDDNNPRHKAPEGPDIGNQPFQRLAMMATVV
jgi:hypothetical protein